MKTIMVFVSVILLFVSCTPQGVVENYLNNLIQDKGGDEYLIEDPDGREAIFVTKSGEFKNIYVLDDSVISKYEIRGYEILNASGSVISAKIIFGSKAGTDLPKTFKFEVDEGKITRIW